MTSKRPPRRDPRAEDEQSPPDDNLGARRARPATRPASSPGAGPTDTEFELLRSRYAEAETKRRRAEALADGLAQRVASLEAELRARTPTGSDDSRRRLELRVSELEGDLKSTVMQVEQARSALVASEAANASRDEAVSVARARTDAAEDALAKLEERTSREERDRVPAGDYETRIAALESQLAAVREEANEASVRHSSASIDVEAKLASAEERAKKAEEARSTESTSATEARAKLASMAAKASEAALKVASLTEELARSKTEWDGRRGELESAGRTLESDKAEMAAKLATTSAKLSATESKVSTLQSMATELDQALQRERTRASEIEAGQRRVQTAAMSSAREVIARLERHEEKLSSLRRDALNRALALLDEAGGLHGQNAAASGRLTPSVPSSRPVIAVAKATSAQTTPGAPRPDKTARGEAARASAAGTSGDQNTPMQGTTRQANPKRTMQGLSALPRGAFGSDETSATAPLPPKPEEPDIEISVDDES